MQFNPDQLTASASLNRLRVEGDGKKIPAEIAGKTGFELCSARALAAMIRRSAPALELQGNIGAEDHELIRRFDNCFAADAPRVRDAAQEVARELARNMAFIVLAAKRRIAAENLDEWERGYWAHWQMISTVVFGGGIMAGNLGSTFSKTVSEQWNNFDFHAVKFLTDPRPGRITVDGLLTSLPSREGKFLTLDFGGTFVKRALSICEPGVPPIVHELEKIPVPRDVASPTDDEAGGKIVFDFMSQTIASTWRQHPASVPWIPVSLAAYVIDGHPCSQGGGYTAMRHVTHNVQSALSQDVAKRVAKDLNIQLMHDGTAAALKYAGSPNLAVIMMGTALGVGFAPGH
jgi:hypothetical protein